MNDNSRPYKLYDLAIGFLAGAFCGTIVGVFLAVWAMLYAY